MPTLLRSTLEETAQWGAVRVIPTTADFVDVIVTGTLVDSNGGFLSLDISAVDAAGRTWIHNKRYSSIVDLGAYKTQASLKARDPFQNVYSEIANDLVAARDQLTALDREGIRRVANLKFAADLAPEAMAGMTAVDKNGITQVVRLPADGDPTLGRIERIRDRDTAVVDTVNDYYASFAQNMDDSYDSWRQTSFSELEKEMRARSAARTRTVLGAAALIAAIFAPNSCSTYDSCRINNAARTAGTMGGIAAVLSGIKKYADARTHADALKELTLELPVRSGAPGRRGRRPHAAPHRHRRRPVPRVAQAAEAAVPGRNRQRRGAAPGSAGARDDGDQLQQTAHQLIECGGSSAS